MSVVLAAASQPLLPALVVAGLGAFAWAGLRLIVAWAARREARRLDEFLKAVR